MNSRGNPFDSLPSISSTFRPNTDGGNPFHLPEPRCISDFGQTEEEDILSPPPNTSHDQPGVSAEYKPAMQQKNPLPRPPKQQTAKPKNDKRPSPNQNGFHQTAFSALSLEDIIDPLVRSKNFITLDHILYQYNGTIFHEISKEDFPAVIQRLLPKHLIRKVGSLSKIYDAYKWLLNSSRIQHFKTEEIYEQTKFFIPFQNGIYDAKNDRLLSYRPDIPVFYQIDAAYSHNAMHSPTPIWDSFLDSSFHDDKEDAIRLHEMIGYILMPTNDAKVFFVLGTSPNSGKSQLANFLVKVLGRNSVSHVNFHDLKNPFYLGRIVGKRLNVCMDIKSGLLSEEAVANIKLLTGETWLEAEKKYENPRTVFTSCKFIWGSNHPLKVAVPDSAFWNRVIFLPFMFACPEDQKNLNLLQDLYQERDSIITKSALAAHALVQRNLVFTPSSAADSILSEWASNDDEIDSFINNCCEVTDTKDDFIAVRYLYNRFQKYSGDAQMSIQFFSKEVRRRYGLPLLGNNSKKRIGGGCQNVIFGLRWKKESSFPV